MPGRLAGCVLLNSKEYVVCLFPDINADTALKYLDTKMDDNARFSLLIIFLWVKPKTTPYSPPAVYC